MRTLLRGLVVLALLAAAALGLETRLAFARLWLPLASTLVEGDLAAADGRLRLSGELEAHGLRWRAGSRRAEAGRVRLRLAPLASLRAGAPYFREVEASDLRLVWPAGAGGAPDDRATEPARSYQLPCFVERARLGPARVRLPGGELRAARLDAQNLVPGRRGRIELSLAAEMADGAAWRGNARLALTLDVPEARDGALVYQLALEARLTALGLDAWKEGPAALAVTGAGSLASDGRLALDALALDARREEGPLARLELAGQLALEAPRRTIDAELTAVAPGSALARSLHLAGGPGFERALSGAQLAAELRLGGRERGVALSGEARLEGVRLGEDASPTRLALVHEVTVAAGGLDAFDLTLAIETPERPPGRLHAAGHLARAGAGWRGELAFENERLALGPWLAWLGRALPPGVGAAVASGAGRLRVGAEPALAASGAQRVRLEPGAGAPLALTLRDVTLERAAGGDLSFRGALEGPGTGAGPGVVSLEGALGATPDEARALRLRGTAQRFDLTPLLVLLEGGGERARGDGAARRPGPSLDAELALEEVQLRALTIERGRLRLARGPERLELALEDVVVDEGSLDARFVHRSTDGEQQLAWQADVRALDLAALRATLDPGEPGTLRGRLSLSTRGSGRAPPDADPLEAADGSLVLALDDSRGAGLPLLDYVAQLVGVSAFTSLRFDTLSGEFPVRDGVVEVGRAAIGSGPTHLVLSGDFGLRRVDARLNPRVGPGLAPQLAPRFASALFATASGLLALPLEITLRGPWSELRYGAHPVPPARLDRVFGDILGAAGDWLRGDGAPPDGS